MVFRRIDRPVPDQTLQRRVRLRRRAERLRRLAVHLNPTDRQLIDDLNHHGLSLRQIAEHRATSPAALHRRARQLLRRMAQPEFRWLAEHADLLPARTRKLAASVVHDGRSLRDAARTLHVSVHRVRQALATLKALARF